ncbi:MAG: tetratricopeptide repeat protein [Gemmataceae bacterium]
MNTLQENSLDRPFVFEARMLHQIGAPPTEAVSKVARLSERRDTPRHQLTPKIALFLALISLATGLLAVDQQQCHAAYQQQEAKDAIAKALAQKQRLREDQLRHAKEQLNLGSLAAEKGQHADAVTSYRQGLAGLELLTSPGDEAIASDMADAYLGLGESLIHLGNSADAETCLQKTIALRRQLMSTHLGNVKLKQSLGKALYDLERLHQNSGRFADAEAQLREVIRLRDEVYQAAPENAEYAQDLAQSLEDLGVQLSSRRKYHDAELVVRQALTICEGFAARFGSAPEFRSLLGDLYVKFAGLQIQQKQSAEGDSAAHRAITIAERLLAGSPNEPQFAALLGNALSRYGDVQMDRDVAGALESYDRAIQVLESAFEKTPTHAALREALGHAFEQRAAAKMWQNRLSDAQADWRRAVALAPENTRPAQLARWGMLLARAGFVIEATLAIEPLIGAHSTGETLYLAARIFSRIAVATNDDDADYSARALELLQQAIDKGYRDFELMKFDEEFAPLRERGEYRKLIAEWERKQLSGQARAASDSVHIDDSRRGRIGGQQRNSPTTNDF